MSAGYQNGQHRTAGAGAPAEHPADWDGLRQDVRQLGDVAMERGYGLVEAARDQVNGYVDRRKGDAAQSVSDLAQALRESGGRLEQQPNVKAFFDSAAEGLEQLSGSIKERSFEDFYSDIEAVARRRPAAVAVATFLTGFLAARFIKSSAHPPHVFEGREAFAGGEVARPDPYRTGDAHRGTRYPA
ncbi:hypothetical protein OPKNFCMD_0161 [Methylobacterium crusticola]|uniref:Uncharacterized protein n=1 Tax=Methylobacterium crusticola TaxID=1697972 RepID=A0ABQ4QQ81_9HYPH|nr:hypothetical protein [Methylobacterium crusticola]GJD47453.1 hypothetical protein OPKNFCMD_0161 [Methylobacterium crusticola]